MKKVDSFSYQLGVIDAFNEMLNAGVKQIALSHPTTKEDNDALYEACQTITERYQTKIYIEEEPLLSDLFPLSLSKGKCHLLFYKDDAYLDAYLALKRKKESSIQQHTYADHREMIACAFGELLSYDKATCLAYINKHDEKEN